MGRFSIIKIFLILSLASSYVLGVEEGVVELKNAKGAAPLTVKVSGPESLLENRYVNPHPFVGCGFSINWGDGAPLSSSCAEWLTHTYKTPGHYEVVATIWHPGPTDIPIITWRGRSEVIVTGDGSALSSLDSM